MVILKNCDFFPHITELLLHLGFLHLKRLDLLEPVLDHVEVSWAFPEQFLHFLDLKYVIFLLLNPYLELNAHKLHIQHNDYRLQTLVYRSSI